MWSRRPSWAPATPPVEPRRPPRLLTVDDAYLSEVATGDLATVYHLDQWFRGAVYDAEDTLVTASQKLLGNPRGKRVAADPERVVRRDDADALSGTWLYGGTWASVYGHFLVETLTSLWPTLDERPAGLVFHSSFGRHRTSDWQQRLLELAGWGDLTIHVVDRARPAHADRLVVPGRSVALHAWAHPEARDVWQRISAGHAERGGPERVWISRTALNAARRAEGHRRPIRTTAEEDRALDDAFADRGFEVLAPETLTIDEQLERVAPARVIAGLSGSGLHQSAFMAPGGRVLEVGDGRSAEEPVAMQVAIDAALGHERAFVPGGTGSEDVRRTLRHLGL
ncbi:Capsular polysaccharide biosynthesis protein [Nocardioides exalbidus]|uniref:Capsular polysaccharide biosynthesis protein n=2 Tax=Nocardioides exalbidus TaxID=402596 RepID=A0A1H4X881_9ACTN|nr:Capsular polysaccharide biosynthesis protein [Nocardioides exalbidus]